MPWQGSVPSGHFIALDGTYDNGPRRWRKGHNGSFIGNPWGERMGSNKGDTKLYDKPVPYPVLVTVDRIKARFPATDFRISDEAIRQATVKDPFLMVIHEDRRYIVERWDEPGFVG